MKTTKKFDVTCIGAALVDIVAQVQRHPLEDDEVFVSDLKLLSGGAAANTAYACGRLGLKTVFLGKLGKNDTFGFKIIKDFKVVNVNTSLIKYSSEYSTGSAYIVLDKEGDRRIYAHSGAANHLTEKDIDEQELISTKIIFLSSLKNLIPLIKAAKIGKKNKIPVILNPGMLIAEQGLNKIKELLENIDVLILSKREFQTLLITEVNNKDSLNLIREKAKILFSLGIRTVIITMGKRGAILLDLECSKLIKSINVKQVVDTTGAGDAFSAGFIYGFIKNTHFNFDELLKNVKLGNFIAGKCIQKLGARNGVPNREELLSEFFK